MSTFAFLMLFPAACQAAEASKGLVEEKEEEIRILDRSVEELESTVYALETQVDDMF
jgi:kinesin family protein 15